MKWRAWTVCAGLLVALSGAARCQGVVLLDEYWAPEILVNDVRVTEIDTQVTGDKTQAKFGDFSAQLVNETGFPNVRFRAAATIRLDKLPVGDTEARLWYRTDHWTGAWRMEIWVYDEGLEAGPVKVLEADLDGGGFGGTLVPDDQWHQAKGRVRKCPDYARLPKDLSLVTYVWLAPTGGWNVAHRTFVDRAELIVLSEEKAGKEPPTPVKHIRPRPGAQTNGDGWVWFEGEDATKSNVLPGGALLPDNTQQQDVLSNGAWLQHHANKGMALMWEVDVPQAGTYDFWCRAMPASFKWAWDAGEWNYADEKSGWQDEVTIRWNSKNPLSVLWAKLGTVALTRGKHLLQVEEGHVPDDVVAIDCWLLTTKPFTPHGAAKPGATAAP